MTFGIDYAWADATIAELVAAMEGEQAQFIGRYVSSDSSKNLSKAEAVAMAARDISCVVVWEDAADRALDGHAAGAGDARTAAAQAKACGMPADRPIFFAVDFDATSGQYAAINSYLDGAASVIGKDRVGIYGGYGAVKSALDGGHCGWAWQTYAWSGGKWDSRAQLQQYSNDHTVSGVGCDYNRAVTVADYGQWRPGWSPALTTKAQEDQDMYGQVTIGKGAVTPISMPTKTVTAIGVWGDTGLAGNIPVQLRIAFGKSGSPYSVHHVVVDSTKPKPTVAIPSAADSISISRENTGETADKADAVPIAWDMS